MENNKKIKNAIYPGIFIGIILMPVLIVICCSMASCNQQIVDTSYTFNKAYITVGSSTITVDVKTWNDYDDSDMVQVTAKDGTVYYSHSSNIILVKED